MSSIARAIAILVLAASSACTVVGAEVTRERHRDQVTRVTPDAFDGRARHADFVQLALRDGSIIGFADVGLAVDQSELVVSGVGKTLRYARESVDVIELRQRTTRTLKEAESRWAPGDGLTWVIGFVAIAFVVGQVLQ